MHTVTLCLWWEVSDISRFSSAYDLSHQLSSKGHTLLRRWLQPWPPQSRLMGRTRGTATGYIGAFRETIVSTSVERHYFSSFIHQTSLATAATASWNAWRPKNMSNLSNIRLAGTFTANVVDLYHMASSKSTRGRAVASGPRGLPLPFLFKNVSLANRS